MKSNNVIGWSVLTLVVVIIISALMFGKTDEGVSALANTSTAGFVGAIVFYIATIGLIVYGVKNGETTSLPVWYTFAFFATAVIATCFLFGIFL